MVKKCFSGIPRNSAATHHGQMALLTDAIGRWIINFGTVTFHSETRYAHSETGGHCVKLVHLWLETCTTVSLLLEFVWQLICNDTTKSNDLEETFARKSSRWKKTIIKKNRWFFKCFFNWTMKFHKLLNYFFSSSFYWRENIIFN